MPVYVGIMEIDVAKFRYYAIPICNSADIQITDGNVHNSNTL